MEVELIKWQKDVFIDKHRFKIVCAGRRAGKSVLSRIILLDWALKNRGLYWIVSPTYKQSKMIHWRDYFREIPREWIVKKNEIELSFTLRNGSIIELKGAENPDALRGVKLKGLIIDEIASIRNWDWVWTEVLRPTLTDYEAPAIFISTPKGYNHFYDLYELGQKDSKTYKSWRFTSYENTTLPKQEIEEAKKELTEDTFVQEYLADFRKFTGLVYKDFDRQVHVIDAFDFPDNFNLYRGFDFGFTNPTACIWIAVDGDSNWFIVDEHYQSDKTIDYHAGIINSSKYQSITSSYGDPSSAQWIKEFQNKGIYITPATKEINTSSNLWVNLGIEKVAEKLKLVQGKIVHHLDNTKGLPSLFIFRNCVNTIREFETYHWKEKAITQSQNLNEPDVPEKANDHILDALRYFAISYRQKQKYVYKPKKFNYRIGL